MRSQTLRSVRRSRGDRCYGLGLCSKEDSCRKSRPVAKATLDVPVFRLLGIKPSGEVNDPRVWTITCRQLTAQRSAWPVGDVRIVKGMQSNRTPAKDIIAKMLTRPLSANLGAELHYNGPDLRLCHLVCHEVTGMRLMDVVRAELLPQTSADPIDVGTREFRERIPWHPPGAKWGGWIQTAPSLSEFLESTSPGSGPRGTAIMYGALPHCTAVSVKRSDHRVAPPLPFCSRQSTNYVQ